MYILGYMNTTDIFILVVLGENDVWTIGSGKQRNDIYVIYPKSKRSFDLLCFWCYYNMSCGFILYILGMYYAFGTYS